MCVLFVQEGKLAADIKPQFGKLVITYSGNIKFWWALNLV